MDGAHGKNAVGGDVPHRQIHCICTSRNQNLIILLLFAGRQSQFPAGSIQCRNSYPTMQVAGVFGQNLLGRPIGEHGLVGDLAFYIIGRQHRVDGRMREGGIDIHLSLAAAFPDGAQGIIPRTAKPDNCKSTHSFLLKNGYGTTSSSWAAR